jgi:hypothetical protein
MLAGKNYGCPLLLKDTTQKLINLKKLEDAMLLLMDKIKGHENNEASTKMYEIVSENF